MEVIISHIHLDLDGFASMVLAKKLYPNAILVFSGDLSHNVKALANLYQDYLEIFKSSEISMDKIRKLIIVDTANKKRIGKFEDIVDKVEVIVYDHHISSEFDIISNEKYISTNGSNASHMLEKILEKTEDLKLEPFEATIAIMGIYEDTGNFVFNSTKEMDFIMAGKLVSYGANISMIYEYVNKNLKQQELDMLLELIKGGEVIVCNEYPVFVTVYHSQEYFNGIDILVNKIMELEGAEACFIIFGTDERSSVIARSKNKDINVSKILKKFGNGGHHYAVSTVIKNLSLKEIKKLLKEELLKKISKGKLAKDIMKSPVKIVDSESRIKDVHKIMIRFGYNGIPLMKDEKLIGIISRRDIDKAINHGFANAPARAYMSKHLISAGPKTPVKDLKRIIIENEIGRIPILENSKLIGIVTRSDILRSLYEQRIKKDKLEVDKKNEIRVKILNKIPKKIIGILRKVEAVSKIRKEKAYLVGGIVRDIILDIENLDIDIVVEGDGLAFAEDFAKIIKAKKIVKHEKFKTAVVILEDNFKIDIASSRIEYYEFPTSLPSVEYASIKQDLYRRDFSINAMAIEIDYENFGKIIDYYNGYKDLKNKKIRILHNLSFIEDPTRIIRAIRFLSRYNFELDDDTENFMLDAIKEGFLNKLSWHRVKNEIIHILKEKNVQKALEKLSEYGIIGAIHKNIKVNTKMKKDLNNLEINKDFILKQNVELWLMYLLIILEDLKKEELDFVFMRFSFSADFIKKYDFGIRMRANIIKNLDLIEKPSEIYTLLNNISIEIILLIYITNKKIRNKILYYIENIKYIKPLIGGKDLIDLGYKASKEFKTYLEELYMLQIDNNIKNKEELYERWRNNN